MRYRLLMLCALIVITVGCAEATATAVPTTAPTSEPTATDLPVTAEQPTPTAAPTLPPDFTPTARPPEPTATPYAFAYTPPGWTTDLPVGARQRLGIGGMRAVELSPDGAHLAAGTTTGVYMFSTETWDEEWRITGPAVVEGLAWSPDGSQLAVWTARGSGLVALLDAATGDVTAEFAPEDIVFIENVSWSSDGTLLAVASWRGIFILDRSGALVGTLADGEQVIGVRWSSSGNLLAAGTIESLKVWHMPDGDLILEAPMQGERAVLAFNAQETHLAVTTTAGYTDAPRYDSRIHVWDLALLEEVVLEGAGDADLEWSPDGQTLASARLIEDGSVFRWTIGDEVPTIMATDTRFINDIAWSPDGSMLLTGSSIYYEVGFDYEATVWDAATGEPLLTLADEGIGHVFWLPDGSFGTAGNAQIHVRDRAGNLTHSVEADYHGGREWSADGMTLLPPVPLPDIEGADWTVPSNDGTKLAALHNDGNVAIYDAAGRTVLQEWFSSTIGASGFTMAYWSPDDSRLLLGIEVNGQYEVSVWDVTSGTALFEDLNVPSDQRDLYDVVWLPDSEEFATVYERFIQVYYATSGTPARQITIPAGEIETLAWSPDGMYLAVGYTVWPDEEAQQQSLVVVEAAKGVLVMVLDGHPASVSALAWSPDGTMLASAGGAPIGHGSPFVSGWEENVVLIWDAASGELLHTFLGHNGAVYRVWWSPDGGSVATSSADGTAFIWAVK